MRGSKQTEQESGRKGEGTPHRHLVLYKGTNTIMGSSQVDHAHTHTERERYPPPRRDARRPGIAKTMRTSMPCG